MFRTHGAGIHLANERYRQAGNLIRGWNSSGCSQLVLAVLFTAGSSCLVHSWFKLFSSQLVQAVLFTAGSSCFVHSWFQLFCSQLVQAVLFTSGSSCPVHSWFKLSSSQLVQAALFTAGSDCPGSQLVPAVLVHSWFQLSWFTAGSSCPGSQLDLAVLVHSWFQSRTYNKEGQRQNQYNTVHRAHKLSDPAVHQRRCCTQYIHLSIFLVPSLLYPSSFRPSLHFPDPRQIIITRYPAPPHCPTNYRPRCLVCGSLRISLPKLRLYFRFRTRA